MLHEIGLTEQDIFSRYDAVIYFETAACYSASKYVVNNARAMATPTYVEAIEQDRKTKAVWSSHPNFYMILATEDFDEKIRSLYKILHALKTVPKITANSIKEENKPTLIVKKISDTAICPKFRSKGAAGIDLHSDISTSVLPRTRRLIPIGIIVSLPVGYYGRIAPRSGISVYKSIDIGAGVIDSDYRGEINVLLINHSDKKFDVNKGDRVAQMICERICYPEIKVVIELSETERGSNGFGSTGFV